MKVVLASKNPHKLVEISAILKPLNIELVLESDLGVDVEVEETGQTFEENSFLKAHAVMEATGLPALADDSGIAVDALGGAPGVHSARYGDDPSLDDWGRLLLLLKNTQQVPDGQRQAQFVSVITLVYPDGRMIQAGREAMGSFCGRPMEQAASATTPFSTIPCGKTFAELTAGEKSQVSHRAVALKLFYEKLCQEAEYADQ
ncbi:MAG: non-canonical purine NTP pyrophosphatase [Oscillospiraceae bacterium]